MGNSFLPGDANLDGVVTEADIELVQSYIDDPSLNFNGRIYKCNINNNFTIDQGI